MKKKLDNGVGIRILNHKFTSSQVHKHKKKCKKSEKKSWTMVWESVYSTTSSQVHKFTSTNKNAKRVKKDLDNGVIIRVLNHKFTSRIRSLGMEHTTVLEEYQKQKVNAMKRIKALQKLIDSGHGDALLASYVGNPNAVSRYSAKARCVNNIDWIGGHIAMTVIGPRKNKGNVVYIAYYLSPLRRKENE